MHDREKKRVVEVILDFTRSYVLSDDRSIVVSCQELSEVSFLVLFVKNGSSVAKLGPFEDRGWFPKVVSNLKYYSETCGNCRNPLDFENNFKST